MWHPEPAQSHLLAAAHPEQHCFSWQGFGVGGTANKSGSEFLSIILPT